jgi:hypothetical protein
LTTSFFNSTTVSALMNFLTWKSFPIPNKMMMGAIRLIIRNKGPSHFNEYPIE